MLPTAQWLVLGGWLAAGLVFVGWGLLALRLWRAPARDADDLLASFWLGWATLLGTLQLWHFVLPVRTGAQAAAAAVGLAGLVGGGWRPWGRLMRRALPNAPVLVAVAAVAWWISNRALGGPRFGDTGGYYVPTIRWVTEYPVVVGLGNLYAPYAYNQTYFLYAALLSAGPFSGRPHHLLNSILLLALCARSLLGAWRTVCSRGRRRADLFHTLMVPAEAILAFGYLFTSPAPDFGVFVLGIALMGELIALAESERRARLHFLVLVVLAAVGPTVKLGFAGMAAAALPVAAWWWIRRARPSWRAGLGGIAVAGAVGVGAIGPWVAGNTLMSGCPLFPSTVGALPVAWRVDWDVRQWIQNTMYLGDWHVVVRAPRWFLQRLQALGWTERDVLLPLIVAAGAAVLGAVRFVVRVARRRPPVPDRLPLLLLLPPIASLAFCFAYTPVPRYAGATMWVLGVVGVMLALGDALLTRVGRLASTAAALTLASLPFFDGAPIVLDARDFQLSPAPRVEKVRTDSGLEVYVPPPEIGSCWDAPLPCTPRLHPGLRLRRAGDLGSGFAVDRSAGAGSTGGAGGSP